MKALLAGNVSYMNLYMNQVALQTFSFFDSGNHPSDYTEPEKEETLDDTVRSVKEQIQEKKYAEDLRAKGIADEQIHEYGFAFEGKKVLIG